MDLGLVQCDTPDSSSMIRVDLPLAELDEVDGVPVEELEQTDDIGVYRITNSFYVPGREDLDRLLLKAVRNDAQKEFRREIESIFNQREGRVNNSGKPLRPPGAGKTIRQPWKSSATVFRRLSYDPATDTSLVACRPGQPSILGASQTGCVFSPPAVCVCFFCCFPSRFLDTQRRDELIRSVSTSPGWGIRSRTISSTEGSRSLRAGIVSIRRTANFGLVSVPRLPVLLSPSCFPPSVILSEFSTRLRSLSPDTVR